MNSLDFHSVLPNPSCSWSFSGSTKSPNYLQGKHLGPQSLVLQRRWPAALLQRPSVPKSRNTRRGHRKADGKTAKPDFSKLHLSQVAFSPLLDGLGWKRRSAIVPRSPSSTVAKKVSIFCSEHLINKLKISVTKTPISPNLTLCVYMFHIIYIYIQIYQFSCIFPKDISPCEPANLR